MAQQIYSKTNSLDTFKAYVENGVCVSSLWWQGPADRRLMKTTHDLFAGKTVAELEADGFKRDRQAEEYERITQEEYGE